MPRYDAAQNAFSAGEVSPRLHGRTDLDLYKKALAFCENGRPMGQGSLLMRGGSEKRATAANARRIINFRSKLGEDFDVVLSDRLLRVFSSSGAVPLGGPGGGVQDLVQNGDFGQGLTGWQTANAIDPVTFTAVLPTVTDGVCELPAPCPTPPYNTEDYRASITGGADGFTVGAVSAALAFDMPSVPNQAFARVRVRVFVGLVFPDTVLDVTIQGSGHQVVPVPVESIPAGSHVSWQFQALTKLRIDNVSLVVNTDSGEGTGLAIAAPWTADQLAAVQYVAEPGEDRIIFVHPNVPQQALVRTSQSAWSFSPIAFTNPPAEWAVDYYPAAVEIFQGRLWFARDNHLWGSKSGAHYNFDKGDSTADDAIAELAATKGAFKWLRAKAALFGGTDVSIVSISASGGLLVPGDVQVHEEIGYAAAPVQPVIAGSVLPYVTADRRKVRVIDYNLQREGWEAGDLTFVADHITKGGITEVHFANDSGLLVLLLATGELRLCAWDPEQKIVAWWRAPIAGGAVISAAVRRDVEGEYLQMIVSRDSGAFIERLPLFDAESVAYLDAHVRTILSSQQQVIGGLEHLAGKTVRVIVNGAIDGDYVVAAAGTVTLSAPAEAGPAVIGLPYGMTGELLKLEGGNPAGTAQGHVIAWSEVIVRLNDSALPKVNGQRPSERSQSTPGDTAEPRTTGDMKVRGVNGNIRITQDAPFRTEVCAVFGTASLGKV